MTIDVENVSQSGIVPGGSDAQGEGRRHRHQGRQDDAREGRAPPRPHPVRRARCGSTCPLQAAGAQDRPPGPARAHVRLLRPQRPRPAGLGRGPRTARQRPPRSPPPAPRPGRAREQGPGGQGRRGRRRRPPPQALAAGPATKAQAKADPADGDAEGGSSMSNLTLRRAKATGHAVWLQSTAQHMVAYGNYLRLREVRRRRARLHLLLRRQVHRGREDRRLRRRARTSASPDRSTPPAPATSPSTATSPAAAPPRSSPEAPAPRRPARPAATWSSGSPRGRTRCRSSRRRAPRAARITLKGHPRVRSATQGDMTADREIIADLEPKDKEKPDDEDKVRVVSRDGKPVAPREPGPSPTRRRTRTRRPSRPRATRCGSSTSRPSATSCS